MSHLTLQIVSGGPLIDVTVSVSMARREALTKAGYPIPSGVHVRALIDTGASCSCVHADALQPLQLSPTGRVTVYTPSTAGAPHDFDQYDVSLTLLHPDSHLVLPNVAVIAARLPDSGIQALIGRDVLKSCLFIYNGLEETFTLAF